MLRLPKTILIALTLTTGLTPTVAAAQTGDCPDGYECLTPDAEYCLSSEALNQYEEDLTNCQERKDEMRGRVEECRDSVEPVQARNEQLAAQVGQTKSRLKLWKTIAGGAAGTAVVATVTLVGHFSGWWRLPSPRR